MFHAQTVTGQDTACPVNVLEMAWHAIFFPLVSRHESAHKATAQLLSERNLKPTYIHVKGTCKYACNTHAVHTLYERCTHTAPALQGYAIGNGVTDDEVDGNAIIPFAYGKSLLGTQLYMDLMHECQGSFWNVTPGKPSCPLTASLTHTHIAQFTVHHQCTLDGGWYDD